MCVSILTYIKKLDVRGGEHEAEIRVENLKLGQTSPFIYVYC